MRIIAADCRRCWAVEGAAVCDRSDAGSELHRALPERLEKRLRGVEAIHAGQTFSIGDIEVHPFRIPHDSADPVGFSFRANGVKFAHRDGSGIHAGAGESAFARFGLFDAGIESRSGDAEGWAVSVGGEAAGAEPHGAFVESRGE